MGDNLYLFLFETSIHYIIPLTPCPPPQKSEIKIKKGGRKRKTLVDAMGEFAVIANVSIPPFFFPPVSLAYR